MNDKSRKFRGTHGTWKNNGQGTIYIEIPSTDGEVKSTIAKCMNFNIKENSNLIIASPYLLELALKIERHFQTISLTQDRKFTPCVILPNI